MQLTPLIMFLTLSIPVLGSGTKFKCSNGDRGVCCNKGILGDCTSIPNPSIKENAELTMVTLGVRSHNARIGRTNGYLCNEGQISARSGFCCPPAVVSYHEREAEKPMTDAACRLPSSRHIFRWERLMESYVPAKDFDKFDSMFLDGILDGTLRKYTRSEEYSC